MSGEEIYFSNNYSDQCIRNGTGAGFQFDFYCQRCSDTWRSPFEPFRTARAADWLQRGVGAAWGAFGRTGSEATSAVGGFAEAGWGKARDKAFGKAIDAATQHFNRCPRCTNYTCGRCFNVQHGLCLGCAPDTAAEAAAAQVQGLNYGVSQRAQELGQAQAGSWDLNAPRQLVCPNCATETHGARFCPGCGHQLGQSAACGGCHQPVPAGSAFCPNCGNRQ